jgi:hypothetical protein
MDFKDNFAAGTRMRFVDSILFEAKIYLLFHNFNDIINENAGK